MTEEEGAAFRMTGGRRAAFRMTGDEGAVFRMTGWRWLRSGWRGGGAVFGVTGVGFFGGGRRCWWGFWRRCWVGYWVGSLFFRNTSVIQVGVGLGSCAKAQGSLLVDIAVGLFLMPSP